MSCFIKYKNLEFPSEAAFKDYVEANPQEFNKYLSFSDLENSQVFDASLNYNFRVADTILKNLDKVKRWEKDVQNPPVLWEKIQKDLGISKVQVELLKNTEGENIEEKLTNFIANYSYTVEVTTAKTNKPVKEKIYTIDNYNYIGRDENGIYIVEQAPYGDTLEYIGEEQGKKIMGEELYNKLALTKTYENTQYYSNLTVPGGTNYTENEIATPAITPSILGHAQFATNKGIGWFRSDDKLDNPVEKDFEDYDSVDVETQIQYKGDISKTRRILEVQSDLFQKGRDNKRLVGEEDQIGADIDEAIEAIEERVKEGSFTREYADNEIKKLKSEQNSTQNQFFQLLNKDNNWVTFFIKSIIQDSAKQTITEVQESDVEAKVRELENSGLLKIKCN